MSRRQIFAIPNDRSSHSQPVPNSGGVGIVMGVIVGVVSLTLIFNFPALVTPVYLAVFLGAMLLAIGGFLDDLGIAKSFQVKLAFQFLAVLSLFVGGVVIDEVSLPVFGLVELGYLGYVLTLIWVVGLTNAFNFMDGIDGLAAGTSLISGVFVAVVAFMTGQSAIGFVVLIIAAASLGFMVFNFPSAKIFMGDVGSQFLGFLFAAMMILSLNSDPDHTSWFIIPLLFFHFIFDTAFTFARRLRAGERVTKAHRTHLYQLFVQIGYSHAAVSLVHFMICIIQGLAVWLVFEQPPYLHWLIFIPFLVCEIVYSAIVTAKARKAGVEF